MVPYEDDIFKAAVSLWDWILSEEMDTNGL